MTKKDDILEAANLLFARKGFKDTSMAEVSKLTGAAEGTIFYHFKTKEGIFLSILEKVKEEITAEFSAYRKAREFRNGLEMMAGAVAFYLHQVGQMEDRFLILYSHYPYELARTNPRCRDNLTAIYECLLDIFEEAILTGQKDGSIRPGASRKTAMLIFAMLDGLVRLNIYNLYDAGALYNDLQAACHRILRNP
jgi:AcrR family transcriptional regulator